MIVRRPVSRDAPPGKCNPTSNVEYALVVTGALLAAIITGFRLAKSLLKHRPRIDG